MYSVQNPYNKHHSSGSPTDSTETRLRHLISAYSHTGASNDDVAPPLASVQAVYEQIVSKRDIEWTSDLALSLGAFVGNNAGHLLVALQTKASPCRTDVGNAALLLLQAAMEDWQDQMLYAVMVQELPVEQRRSQRNSNGNAEYLFSMITGLVLQTEYPSMIHQNAMSVLALMWRSFDWMDQSLSLSYEESHYKFGDSVDTPWWIRDVQIESLVSLSLKHLHHCFQENDDFGIQSTSLASVERSKLAALTMATFFLRRRLLDMETISRTLRQSQLSDVTSKLIKGIQILGHTVLPPSSSEYTLPLALMSLSMLTLLRHSSTTSTDVFQSINQTIQSTRLVENLLEFSLPASPPRESSMTGGATSRWIGTASRRFPKEFLQSFGVTVLTCWKSTDQAAWQVASRYLETKLSSTVCDFWSILLQGQAESQRHLNVLVPDIECLLRLDRRNTRRLLFDAIQSPPMNNLSSSQMIRVGCSEEIAGAHRLLQSLFGLLEKPAGISCYAQLLVARVLHSLLSDRASISTDDELSRLLWLVIDTSFVERHWENVLEHSTTDDQDQPLLLALLDLLSVLTEKDSFRNHLVTKLNASNIEAMVYLVKPKVVRYDFLETDDDTLLQCDTKVDFETPPQNNLSRMDETSICIEQEQIKKPRGLDLAVRFTAAGVLANVAFQTEAARTDESTRLVLSRVSGALHDFLLDSQMKDMEIGWMSMSLDRAKRLFRLQVAMCTAETESLIVDTIHTSHSWFRKELLQAEASEERLAKELESAMAIEKYLKEHNSKLEQKLRTQSTLFQQTVSRMKARMAHETKEVVTLHSLERKKAEQESAKALQQCRNATAEMEKAKEEAVELKRNAEQARTDLSAANKRIEELHERIVTLRRQVDEERAVASELSGRMDTANARINLFEKNNRTMHQAVNEREDVITRVKDSNHQLHNNLEDLFADMCSLSQIYQQTEEVAETYKLKSASEAEKMSMELDAERTRTSELGSKMKSLEEENDKLYRKLAKYKERLEQERKERIEEHEQRKDIENRKRRTGPVSYLNSLHTSNISDNNAPSQRPSAREKTSHDKENGSFNYYTNASQRRGLP